MHRVNQKYRGGPESVAIRRSTSSIRNSLRNDRDGRTEREKSRVVATARYENKRKHVSEKEGKKRDVLTNPPRTGTGRNDVAEAVNRTDAERARPRQDNRI